VRYFIAGGGCYGSYYVRQLQRARERNLLKVDEIVVVDLNPACAVAATLPSIAGARLEVADWCRFGDTIFRNRSQWLNDMWVPTPLGPHIVLHWMKEEIRREWGVDPQPEAYPQKPPALPFAQVLPSGSLALSHAPGLCPVNCVEPKLCPLTKGPRDWEMADTVRTLLPVVGVFLCQHHAHGVGTIPLRNLYEERDRLIDAIRNGQKTVGIATVSSCHGLLDILKI